MSEPPPPHPTPAAAAVVLRGDAVLLIRRGRPPHSGIWTFPGGSVEPGETAREAAVREAREETGIEIEVLEVADVVDVVVPATEAHPAFHYVITDFLAVAPGDATPHPGDDAAEARWVPLADLDRYELTPVMRAVLDRARQRDDFGFRISDFGFGDGSVSSKSEIRNPKSEIVTVRGLGEFGLIDRLSKLLGTVAAAPGRDTIELGIGDDAAVMRPPRGARVVATVDTLVEGIHFRRDWTGAEDLGWKALAVNVSDVAAMGGEPWAALVSLALPADVPVAWVEGLYRGLAECARRYGCAIVGGDTVGSPHDIAITVALLGTASRSEIRLRSGARPGDLVCVTGTLGDSAGGLALLQAGRRLPESPEWEALFRAHLRPEPPLAAARALAGDPAVTAMMDLSDGLASDLRHLCARSGVGARIRAAEIPISAAARSAAAALGRDPLEWALRGGEDYQLLFTLGPGSRGRLADVTRSTGTPIHVVGEITDTGYTIAASDGREVPLSPQAFDHFGRESTG